MRGLSGPPERRHVGAELVRVAADERVGPRERAGRLAVLARALAGSARRAGAGALASGRWLTEILVDAAGELPVRDLDSLRRRHDGRTGDALAEALVQAASRTTAGIGAAGGALAAAEFGAPPLLLSAPVQLAAETLAVVAVEVRLVAELHEVYGREVAGPAGRRAGAYLAAWARRRGVDPLSATGLPGVLTGAARREVRARLLRRLGRNLSTFAPLLAGAAAGAELNRRETRRLAERVIADLRR